MSFTFSNFVAIYYTIYDTLKNELINLHNYHTEKDLYKAIEEFAYTQYNHVRPHSYYNNYRTPFEARYGA